MGVRQEAGLLLFKCALGKEHQPRSEESCLSRLLATVCPQWPHVYSKRVGLVVLMPSLVAHPWHALAVCRTNDDAPPLGQVQGTHGPRRAQENGVLQLPRVQLVSEF